jgi:hypothetical protein
MGRYGIVRDVNDFTEIPNNILGMDIVAVQRTKDALLDAMCDKVTIGDSPLHGIVMLSQVLLQMRRVTRNIWIWLVGGLLGQNGSSQATRACMN